MSADPRLALVDQAVRLLVQAMAACPLGEETTRETSAVVDAWAAADAARATLGDGAVPTRGPR